MVLDRKQLEQISRLGKLVGLELDIVAIDVIFGLQALAEDKGGDVSINQVDELVQTIMGKYPQK